MSTKDCPSCGAVVPASASRCKDCFHDFTEDDLPARSNTGPILVLGTLAAMAVVGAGTLWFIVSQPIEEKIHVQQETQSVVKVRKYRNRVESEQLRFDDIVKLEYVLHTGGTFEVVAVTTAGEREVIHTDKRPLRSEAARYAQLMDKPLEEIDNTRGFHTMGED